jgi:tripartite-type tricarboxylate transporter receptor subunit TctC
MPDVPTFDEGGVPGVHVTNWYSVMSVGGTPKPVLKKLHDELMRAIASADMRQRLAAGALDPAPTTPAEFRKKIADELDRWARVIKDAGIKQE